MATRIAIYQYDDFLPPSIWALVSAAREEAGQLWKRMVKLHHWFRVRHQKWPTQQQFEQHFKGRYKLYSQTIQALIAKFFEAIDSIGTKRVDGDKKARYPWKTRKYKTVPWKGQKVKVVGNRIRLPMPKGCKPIFIHLPEVPEGRIALVEMDYNRMIVTVEQKVDEGEEADAMMPKGKTATIDLGICNLGAMTDGEETLIINGRGLRSLAQQLAKGLAEIASMQACCKKGSRRWKKLQRAKHKLARDIHNRQRNLLHHAANDFIDFAVSHQVNTIVVGDGVAEINKGQSGQKSKRSNQENGLVPLGTLIEYIRTDGGRVGIGLEKDSEAYTTQSCPPCGHRHKPRGRIYNCKACGFIAVRDEVGCYNMLNKRLNRGTIVPGFLVPTGKIKYLRPVKLRGLRSGAERSSRR